ncbi:Heme-dependent catalase-like protein [Venustampulla echinocandica]|uniref:Heme-dependent catalase-like protein n=1 Tax=Venustampulla echinocandica TaxID=2656787 RepID=A0A370TQ89_9HELO|nr:Heme-dependent catalase-like protein [Venustampulla echinocandica]RDL37697.1 Heme-dependent catalase-like protein [Venustampulla echinocandica]
MPFPNDEVLMKTAGDLVAQLQAIFGKHPGFRPAHAKGEILTGTFTPSAEAKKLTTAPHFNNPSTPVWVRFSSSTGLPNIPDTDSHADPRGIAIRFILGDRKHTDIISHSTPFFPARTGQGFLEFLQALASSPPDGPKPSPVEQFLGANPKALAFVQAPKPAPASYGTEEYFGVTAFKLINAEGKATFIRYHIVPEAGVSTLSADELKDKDPDYLRKELTERLASGPISFKIKAQVAAEGDVTDDATVHWPEDRPVVELGTLKLDSVLPDNAKEQKNIIFDPIPRVQGVEPSDDPLLEMRAAVYLISGKQRRAA